MRDQNIYEYKNYASFFGQEISRLHLDRTTGRHRDYRHLAAMLLPALSSAKQTALRTRCVSGLKQCGLAAIMYANDNRDLLPYAFVMSGRMNSSKARGITKTHG